jgi:hypothetical protein
MCIKHEHKASNNYKQRSECERSRDSTKLPKECEELTPRTQDQSNKEPIKTSIILFTGFSTSSKVRLLCSRHMVHIKQRGTIFQTSKRCFPNQFCHPNRNSFTLPRSTQVSPRERNTKFQTSLATTQCNNKWFTVSPLQLHIQNHPTIKIK